MTEPMKAKILSVFYKDINTPIELGESKGEAPVLDAYRFKREPRFSVEIDIGPEPIGDGMKHALLIGMFIDGIEVPVVTDWLPNTEEDRVRVYILDVPKHPVKLMNPKKVHTVQFRIGGRGYKFDIPQNIPPMVYNIEESPVYFYRFGSMEDGGTPDGWDNAGGSPGTGDTGGVSGGGTCPL